MRSNERRPELWELLPDVEGTFRVSVWEMMRVAGVTEATVTNMVTAETIGSVLLRPAEEQDPAVGRQATVYVQRGTLGDSGCPVVTAALVEISPDLSEE
jgi:hypothetical protein